MPYFADPIEAIEKEEEIKDVTEEEKEQLKDLINKLDEEKEEDMKKSQAEALEKQKLRNETMGELLRSKGFLWLATSNDIIGGWQHAGNVLRIKGERNWLCLTPELWEGTEVASEVLKVHIFIFFKIHILEIVIFQKFTFLKFLYFKKVVFKIHI